MSLSVEDVVIVGAGAAGLMAAVTCGHRPLKGVLLDANPKAGAKILISGGARCNVTNREVSEKDYVSQNPRVVRNILRAFSSKQTVEFFKTLGAELLSEKDGKFFPSTHSAKTIVGVFLREIQKTEIRLETCRKVKRLEFREGFFHLAGDEFSYFAKTVILCTGGLSYPSLGSEGFGFEIAKAFGHNIVPLTPALTPLRTEDPDWKSLTGISLPCRLTLWEDMKKQAVCQGAFLFTHFGFSGPCVLDISRHWTRSRHPGPVQLFASFLPEESEISLRGILNRAIEKHPRLLLKNFLSERLPERLTGVLLRKLNLREASILNQLKRPEKELLVKAVLHFPLPVSGALGYDKAEVTAGGIDLHEVNPKTLESKICPGLFFAGEVLDVDGRIGGFNFQWAWASGVAAGSGAAARILDKSLPKGAEPI